MNTITRLKFLLIASFVFFMVFASVIFWKSYTSTKITVVNVKNFGAQGDGKTDDTESIQSAINSITSGQISIPAGTYMINSLKSINLKNNISISMNKNTILKAIPNHSSAYSIFKCNNISNFKIDGGTIIGDRTQHTGTTGEWGMGIQINGGSNFSIDSIKITDTWGDGIYIGPGLKGYSEHGKITNTLIDNCRRQGISIISAKNLTLSNNIISNIHGTNPQSGIDIEPNKPNEILENIIIENLYTYHNVGSGIQIFLSKFNSVHKINIIVSNHRDVNSGHGLYVLSNKNSTIQTGKISFKNSTYIDNVVNPIFFYSYINSNTNIALLNPFIILPTKKFINKNDSNNIITVLPTTSKSDNVQIKEPHIYYH